MSEACCTPEGKKFIHSHEYRDVLQEKQDEYPFLNFSSLFHRLDELKLRVMLEGDLQDAIQLSDMVISTADSMIDQHNQIQAQIAEAQQAEAEDDSEEEPEEEDSVGFYAVPVMPSFTSIPLTSDDNTTSNKNLYSYLMDFTKEQINSEEAGTYESIDTPDV